jgi:hypothetical protein
MSDQFSTKEAKNQYDNILEVFNLTPNVFVMKVTKEKLFGVKIDTYIKKEQNLLLSKMHF